MGVPFEAYLAAKFSLDERSVNPGVRAAFLEAIRPLPRIQCLDVGAGTGATFRRLLASGLAMPLHVTALDRERALLDIAREDAGTWLRTQGMTPEEDEVGIRVRGDRDIAFDIAVGDMRDHQPRERYNVITAHALLDLLPLAQALRQFAGWLEPAGYLYTSINYDGTTALTPPAHGHAFEGALLAHYNASMETRRVDGQPTGGASCGRRLEALLPAHGFDIVACGQSDWIVAPVDGRYCDDDAICLEAMLDFISSEGRRSGRFKAQQLAGWYDERLQALRQGQLALRVSHLDLLARYRPDESRSAQK